MTDDAPVDSMRRTLLGAGGLAMTAAASPSLAQSTGPGRAKGLQDPVAEYPKPPFPAQQQPWPGLASRMNPPPDHGESSYKGSGRLLGRKALITGGDSGMGRGAAIAFAREGADVAINYLPAEQSDADHVARLIRAAGRKAVLIPGDLKDEAFCNRLVADVARQLDGLDILARQFSHDSILEITTAEFDETFKTNVYAMFWLTRAAIPLMKPGSTIINTTSVNAYEPGENIIDYAATKGAIMIFIKGLAKQLAPKGIRVNAIAPGPIWTPLQVTVGQPARKIPEFGKEAPMGRPGQPAELAPLYVLLASPESSYSTGQVFAAVGGHGGP